MSKGFTGSIWQPALGEGTVRMPFLSTASRSSFSVAELCVRANSAKTLCTFSQRQKALLVSGNAPCKLDNNPFTICKHCHMCVCLALQAIAQTVKKKAGSGSWDFQESPFLLQTHPALRASTNILNDQQSKFVKKQSAFSVNSHSREANRSQSD